MCNSILNKKKAGLISGVKIEDRGTLGGSDMKGAQGRPMGPGNVLLDLNDGYKERVQFMEIH